MRMLLLLALLVPVAGCFTIEPLQYTTGGGLVPAYGRAYFLKRGPGGTRVLVCDYRPASTDVVCYESDRAM